MEQFQNKTKTNFFNGFGGVWRGSGGGRCCKHQVKAFVVNGAELGLVSICCASFVMLCMRSFSTSSSSFFFFFFFFFFSGHFPECRIANFTSLPIHTVMQL